MEYKAKLESVLDCLIDSGYPLSMVDQTWFRKMLQFTDHKFKLPGSAKLNKLLFAKWEDGKERMKNLLVRARRVTICVDGWSMKGLSNAFFGISACFYDDSTEKAWHIVLGLVQLHHPHTGEALAKAMLDCFERWQLQSSKIMLVVSDNGSNIVKAVKVMNEFSEAGEQAEAETESVTEDSDDSGDDDATEDLENDENADITTDLDNVMTEFDDHSTYKRMPCMAHTMQLTIKKCYAEHYNKTIVKARVIVSRIRRSSVAVQKLIEKTGKTLISDNSTRWNSTYYMCKRLMDLKIPVNEILIEMDIDTLLVSEWGIIEELVRLLEPFTAHTNLLQSDARSLSYVFPAILDLKCHLTAFSGSAASRKVAADMLEDLQSRFISFLQPSHILFNPWPAAACLLDPTVAALILSPEHDQLVAAAKQFIVTETSVARAVSPSATAIFVATDGAEGEVDIMPPPMKLFRFASSHLRLQHAATNPTDDAAIIAKKQLDQYLAEIQQSVITDPNAFTFWSKRRPIYDKLAKFAFDVITAPASQAYVERIFSVCGLLCAGRRNRMSKSLEMRVWMKLNKTALHSLSLK